jgi:hypothetical protein
MDMGDRIQAAWRTFVTTNIRGKWVERTVDSIEWDEVGEDDALYFYVVFALRVGEPYVDDFDGPMSPDFFPGASSSKLVVAIPVYQGITKEDLLDFNVAEDSHYWDHPDWSNE